MKIETIDMDRTDQAGQMITNIIAKAVMDEVPNKDNKAKALYSAITCMVRGMHLATSLVGWPGSHFTTEDDRDHLNMYDYINEESKTFASLILARISKENSETTVITASLAILALALEQTEMIHGSVDGKIDPVIVAAIRDFQNMSAEEKYATLAPLRAAMQ